MSCKKIAKFSVVLTLVCFSFCEIFWYSGEKSDNLGKNWKIYFKQSFFSSLSKKYSNSKLLVPIGNFGEISRKCTKIQFGVNFKKFLSVRDRSFSIADLKFFSKESWCQNWEKKILNPKKNIQDGIQTPMVAVTECISLLSIATTPKNTCCSCYKPISSQCTSCSTCARYDRKRHMVPMGE